MIINKKYALLIDGDLALYRIACAISEKLMFNGEEAYLLKADGEATGKEIVDCFISTLKEEFKSKYLKLIWCFSAVRNYRKFINPKYKSNRTGIRPIEALNMLQKYVYETQMYKIVLPWIEADDTLGILSTRWNSRESQKKFNVTPVIVTLDKDLKQITGLHYKWAFGGRPSDYVGIDVHEGIHNLFTQVLMGDSTDGFSGAYRVGKGKAKKWIDEFVKDSFEYNNPQSPLLYASRLIEWCSKLYSIQNKKYPFKKANIVENFKMAFILREENYKLSLRKTPDISYEELITFPPYLDMYDSQEITDG